MYTPKPAHALNAVPTSAVCWVAQTWEPALYGSHLSVVCCQEVGMKFVMMLTTNNSATPRVMAPAVCRSAAPMPKASSAAPTRYRPPPTTACSAPCVLRLSDTPLVAQKCAPMKNEAKEMISPTTKATSVRTTSLAKKTFPRRGCADRLVQITPVEYSEVT